MAITVTEVPQNQADGGKVLREQYGLEQKILAFCSNVFSSGSC
mgnify:CR=1 FL=1